MPIFSRFSKNSPERQAKKIIAKAERDVAKRYGPIGKISQAIIQASVACRDATKQLIEAADSKERMQKEISIFYEFIYFYMYMTMRQAFGSLTEAEIKDVQSYLGEVISSVAVDSYFAHWPDDLKQKMIGEFYENLNKSEIEYSESTRFEPQERGSERFAIQFRALFDQLAFNVGNLAADKGKDVAVILPIFETSLREWKSMRLDQLVAEVKLALR